MSNNQVARTLRVDRAAVRRIRGEHDIPQPQAGTRTLEQKWAANVREVDDGTRIHLEWTGPRASSAGTPVLRHQDETYSVAGIAFSMRTGRAPAGQVRPECDHPGCVAPGCVSDEEERTRVREQLRRTLGLQDLPDRCGKGHDQREARRYGPGGEPYCKACVTERKRKQRAKDSKADTS
jgi:hypothetical protein